MKISLLIALLVFSAPIYAKYESLKSVRILEAVTPTDYRIERGQFKLLDATLEDVHISTIQLTTFKRIEGRVVDLECLDNRCIIYLNGNDWREELTRVGLLVMKQPY
ncbi:hypothetical protein AB4254_11625 [Vibrio breoganii]